MTSVNAGGNKFWHGARSRDVKNLCSRVSNESVESEGLAALHVSETHSGSRRWGASGGEYIAIFSQEYIILEGGSVFVRGAEGEFIIEYALFNIRVKII